MSSHSSWLFTSESVTEGHPDKICDQISDAILDANLERDPFARVACEAAVKSRDIFLLGEITVRSREDNPDTNHVELRDVVQGVLDGIGYPADSAFGRGNYKLHVHISEQSDAISKSVDLNGAGDQGMMFGYACRETCARMPLPIELAHRLTREMSIQRKAGTLPWMLADGKSQVTVKYGDGKPVEVNAIVISTQHTPDIGVRDIRTQVERSIIKPVLAEYGLLVPPKEKLHINPTGEFIVGGPEADAGLTGRKIIVDTYGGMSRHGGGAFSGKDATKVDRSGAYMARLLAKCVVDAGLSERCEIQLAYAIGIAKPVGIFLETFGTNCESDYAIVKRIRDCFDLTPQGIIETLDLCRPIFRQTAAYGHFGRPDLNLPWENLELPRAAEFIQSWS